jgi:hypothetical protein
MSAWLARARSAAGCPAAVPIVPIVPKPPPEWSFGTNGTIGTRGRHVAQPSPDPAADGPQGWREALLALSPDRDPCPGFRPDAWARVWAIALDFIDRHGVQAHGLDWTAAELFGVHSAVGVVRRRSCNLPGLHRLGPKAPKRAAGREVALKVEGVVDGGMSGQEALG